MERHCVRLSLTEVQISANFRTNKTNYTARTKTITQKHIFADHDCIGTQGIRVGCCVIVAIRLPTLHTTEPGPTTR